MELVHLLLEATAGFTDDVRCRDAHVIEHKFGGVAASIAHLVDLAADAESRRIRRHDDQAHPVIIAGLRRVIGAGEQADPVSLRAVGDPHLATVDDPVVAITHGARGDPRDVRSGIGLAHRDRAHHLPAQGRLEPLTLQFIRAVSSQGGGGHRALHRDRHRDAGSIAATEFLGEHIGERVVGTATAELLVVLQPDGTDRSELREQLVGGEDPGFLPLIDVGIDLLFDETADRLAEGLVLLGELHVDSFRVDELFRVCDICRDEVHSAVSVGTAMSSS